MYHFCTITTADHLFKVYALFDSIKNQNHAAHLHVLVVDDYIPDTNLDSLSYYSLDNIRNSTVAKEIISKYSRDKDKLRWAMKAVLLKHLLAQKEIEKILYVDNDIFLFNDYVFLFEHLNQYSFLLTPHNYMRNPHKDQIWLEANFRVGLYNAGFVGVNRKAIEGLEWWGGCCAYKTERNAWRGLHDDQKYLDLMPVILDDAYIVRHKGCNVADWNNHVCPRVEVDGEILIDGEFPIIFVHFNATTIRSIITGKEPLLEKHFNTYLAALQKSKPQLKKEDLLVSARWKDTIKLIVWDILTK
ncbi:MAG: glycosyltransferase [Chitinophagales bacterium]|nr:glycosyltransferase [Chitinophagales bacterium]